MCRQNSIIKLSNSMQGAHGFPPRRRAPTCTPSSCVRSSSRGRAATSLYGMYSSVAPRTRRAGPVHRKPREAAHTHTHHPRTVIQAVARLSAPLSQFPQRPVTRPPPVQHNPPSGGIFNSIQFNPPCHLSSTPDTHLPSPTRFYSCGSVLANSANSSVKSSSPRACNDSWRGTATRL